MSCCLLPVIDTVACRTSLSRRYFEQQTRLAAELSANVSIVC